MTVGIGDDSSMDSILTEVGEFGFYQVAIYLLFAIPNILSAGYAVIYMITANTLDYRCKVPQCDIGSNNRDIPYNQSWLQNAIPMNGGAFDSCSYFAPNNFTAIEPNQCSADIFDTSQRIQCTEYVYATDERNLQTEFNIHCDDSYKLALVGTLNNLGRVLLLPLTGLLSDRFGRLTIVIIGMQLNSILGIVKSFSVSYTMYITLELLESMVGAASFEGSYVLAIEWVNSRRRVLAGTIMCIAFALGEMFVGVAAYFVHDFRLLNRILYAPGLFVFVYFWIVPESVRWLLVTGRIERAIKILKRTAKINRKELSTKSIETIYETYTPEAQIKLDPADAKDYQTESHSPIQSLGEIFKSKKLSLRLLNCCYQGAAGCLGYYGISLSSTHIAGANRYLSFIFVMAIEIPGVILAQVLLTRMKRRILLPLVLCLAAFSIITSPFIPKEYSTVVLLLFLLGKLSMACSYTSMLVFTAEQWPTNIRTTVMNSCLMFGRIGSMMAPIIVIMDSQYRAFSALFMGGAAIIAAFLILFCPETFGKKLPDTMKEAKKL